MRAFPLILILFSATVVSATEPIPVVASRQDWPAVKFHRDAQKDLAKGDLEGARQNIAEALRRAPTYWPALFTHAQLLSREGKWDLVIRDTNEVLRRYSAFVPAALLRAHANDKLGNYAEASKEYDHLVAIQPRSLFYAMAFEGRAGFRATCPNPAFHDPRGAIEDAKKACTMTQWQEVDPIETLAVAYAETGDFDSAVRYVEKAMQASNAGEIKKTLERHLAMFKEHRRVTAR